MTTKNITLLALFLVALTGVHAEPLFKVFCAGQPIYRGRVDPIVNPGAVGGHVHRVAGGSAFGPDILPADPIGNYNRMFASKCTSCSITQDLSAYWHPDLHYRWPNGTLSLIPKGGLTIYYLHRSGSGNQSTPVWQAFPPGFRMLAGNPFRRSYNASNVAEQAVSFACLSSAGSGPETPGFPDPSRYCDNGLRLQIHFPQCWNGVDVDSPGHNTHVAYPVDRPDGGNCPAAFPVRLPNLFFEAFYSITDFPRDTTQNRFVLSNGDPTGYGFHGDFLNGWNVPLLQRASNNDPTCDISNTAFGNAVQNCATLAPYLWDHPDGGCVQEKPIPLTENLGAVNSIPNLPGCNPLTYGPAAATPCSSPPSATYQAPLDQRFMLLSKSKNLYVTCPDNSKIQATASVTIPTSSEVFGFVAMTASKAGSLQAEGANLHFWGTGGPNSQVLCDKGSVGSWEQFTFVSQPNGYYAIQAMRNNNFLCVQADGSLAPSSATVKDDSCLFQKVIPNGGGLTTSQAAGSNPTVATSTTAVTSATTAATSTTAKPTTTSTTAATSATTAAATTSSSSTTGTSTGGAASVPLVGTIQVKSSKLWVVVDPTTSRLVATATTAAAADVFTFESTSAGYYISSRSSKLYISAEDAGATGLISNRVGPGGWESFAITASGGYFTILAKANSKLVALNTASSPANQLIATVTGTAPDTALFTITPVTLSGLAAMGSVILKNSLKNNYVVVGNASNLYATATTASAASVFKIGSVTGGSAIIYVATSQYTSADGNTGGGLVANRGSAAGWETFTITLQSSGYYTILAQYNNQYVAVQASNGQLLPNQATGSTPASVLFTITCPNGGLSC